MATYRFECNDCKEEFTDLVLMSESDTCPNTTCPHCESKNWTRLMTMGNFAFSQPEGTAVWNRSHDYRFKHNVPKVKKEREFAEKFSHMGADPYIDTSEEDLKLDTGIHDPDSRKGLS